MSHVIISRKVSDEVENIRLQLKGVRLKKARAYQKAYKDSYHEEISFHDLIENLMDFAFDKDTKFKKWYKQQGI